MKVIGLTGGIGSGKTTISQLFEQLNVPVYNSDNQAKFLMENNPEIKTALTNRFGENVYSPDGSLNRKYLSDLIFKNEENLKWINSIVHPIVAEDFKSWILKQTNSFVILESALLIETLDKLEMDKIIVVTASKPIRLSRVQKRDQLSESEIIQRMGNQLEDEQRIVFADYVIVNEGTKSLIQQTLEIFKKLEEFTKQLD